MQLRWLFVLASVLAAIGLLVWGTSCSKDDEKPPQRTPTKVDPATTGSIKGLVLFKGTLPKRTPLTTGGDAVCAQGEPPLSEHLIVNERSGRLSPG